MTATASGHTTEAQLANGMRVLLVEDHSAAVVSFWTWYRVGSRNELPGKTGISHWVEHMQFKGTPTLAKGQIFRDVSRVGGTLNALTSSDWTAYFETVPSSAIELPLSIESDRMTNSLFDPAEVESERTVILSERAGGENNPGYALYEEVIGAAFQAHPYRHMVIGLEVDLRRLTRDDLFGHYQRYYHPGNAFIVVVGDFDTKEMLARIEQSFGHIPAGTATGTTVDAIEPPQAAERRVVVRRPAGAPIFRLAYRATDAKHPDTVPLLVADAILSGGKSMGFGGGAMGRSSRLYRALVASGLARSASSDMGVTIDPHLFQIGVAALPGGDLATIEQTVDRELTRLAEELVPADELQRAIRQLEAQMTYAQESVTNRGYILGKFEVVDSWRRYDTLLQQLREVSAADVRDVAGRYLSGNNRTVGWLEPTSEKDAASGDESPPALPGYVVTGDAGGGGKPGTSETSPFARVVLDNGITLLAQDRADSHSVAVRVRLPAGSIYEHPDRGGLALLTARSLLRGSAGRSFAELSERLDDLGSSLSIDGGRQFVELRARALSADLPEILALIAAALQQPDFPEAEIEKLIGEQLGAIAEASNDTRATSDRLMRRAVYPEPNPLGRPILGTTETVSSLGRTQVVEFHGRAYGPEGAVIALAGGLGGIDRATELVNTALGTWSTPRSAKIEGQITATNRAAERQIETMSGKSQSDLAIGAATISRRDPGYYALDVANLILGRLGLMGRLGAEVRDRQGLAYYASSHLEPRNDGSLWTARAGIDPQNVERTIGAIEAELRRLQDEPVSATELEDAKSYLVGVLPLATETHDGVLSILLAIEEFDLGLDYLRRYPDIIAAIGPDDVRDAARVIDLDRLVIGIAGPAGDASNADTR